ncbi:Aste57867_5950 [Aphanomyces stellatus]|uniref:Aste57867_5950 protein n=1 Tax=Aphanomyces stellatus TaxID=120398 RepID=A0A485KF92_9STRA|nr:hypothetical protein As57867_005936 [Aphanomyces stellatus]VFT82967.1 Aste57867_5950 [Aphanomyces stellatus]
MQGATAHLPVLDRSQITMPDWLKDHPHILAWDDNFHPSGAAAPTSTEAAPGYMVVDQPRACPGLFRVMENAVSKDLAAQLYASAVETRVWGVYILTTEIFDAKLTAFPPTKDDHERHTLALHAIRQFLVDSKALPSQDWTATHGVVVWVITSDVDDVVAYHMDYAEMFRYQTNVTYPPLYSGTLHVSPLHDGDIQGGEFYAFTSGLDHYKTHGYKASLAPVKNHDKVVSYRHCRGILVDGNFPHGSTVVTALPPETKRVVVGLNLFNHEIGPHAQAYPEHSRKFNKYVKVAQAAAKSQRAALSVDNIRQHPKQAAFLRYLLRKAKEKNLIHNNQFHV